jgi:UDP-N-acetylglucosamine/UDP-N-acetyl-alpha-D-glucosaminouronate 4-epimerase
MTHYLVTGGAGFIGSNLVEWLISQGHQVRVLDDFSTGKRQNLVPFEKQIEIVEGDITRLRDVERAMQEIEVVFHQAALPSVPKSIADPLSSNRASVDGTLHVLLAARDAGVKRVVYASSSSIYGDQAPDLEKVETMTPQPISPYGVAKLAAEHYCGVFYHVYGLETICLRYFNVFGPRQDPESMYAAVIPRFVAALLGGSPPTVYGSGEQTRDFTYVANVVAGNMLASTSPINRVGGEVFNLAAGGQTSINTLIDMLQEIIGGDLAPIHAPPRSGDILHSRADISKAQRLMGYQPAISLLAGLRQTVNWYRDNA